MIPTLRRLWPAFTCVALLRVRAAALIVTLALLQSGCVGDIFPNPTFDGGIRCPQTMNEAEMGNFSEEAFVGAGPVIRFVASDKAERRGYDINITRAFTDHPLGTVFLRVQSEVPGVRDGQTVLLVAETIGDFPALVRGDCPPMVEIPPFEQ